MTSNNIDLALGCSFDYGGREIMRSCSDRGFERGNVLLVGRHGGGAVGWRIDRSENVTVASCKRKVTVKVRDSRRFDDRTPLALEEGFAPVRACWNDH